MISKLNTLKPNTKLKLCMSEKLFMSSKKKDRELIKKSRRGSPTLKKINFSARSFRPHPSLPHHAPRRGGQF